MTGLRISFETDDIQRNAKASQEALRALGAQARQTEVDLKKISEVELRVNDANNLRLGLGPDPLGIRDAISSANEMLAEFAEAKRRAAEVPFGAGIGTGPEFGAGLGGSFTAAELGLQRVVDVEALAQSGANDLGAALRAASSSPDFSRQVLSAQQLADATQGAAERTRELFSLRGSSSVPGLAGATSLGTETAIDARGLEMIRAQGDAYGAARVAAGQYAGSVARVSGEATGALDLHVRSILRLGGAFLGFRGIRAVADDFVSFDKALTGVSQATGLVGPGLDDVRNRIVRISLSGVPVLTEDLLKFAEAAGRIQIRSPEGVEQFVRDIAQLRTIGPDIGGGPDEIGDAVGRFLRLVGEAPSRVQPLTDSIARLDDEFGASGNAIFATGEQVARAGSGFIRSSADALGLGAAMASIGIDGGEAGQVISKFGVVIQKATREGGESLRTLSDLTGLSGEAIRKAFKEDAATLFIAVLKGLAGQGGETSRALDDLGLAEARSARALNPLIQNYELLARGVDESREAQRQGVDAARDAAQIQDTLASRLAQTRNIVTASIGANQGLASSLSAVIGFGNDVASVLLDVADESNKVGVGAQLAAHGIQLATLAAAGGLVVSKLATAYTTLTAATVATDAALVGMAGSGIAATTVVTGLSASITRATAASAAFFATPLGVGVAIGGAVAGLLALNSAIDGSGPNLRGLATEFRELKDEAESLEGSLLSLKDAVDVVADLGGEVSQFSLGKALQIRGLETGNKEDQVRGLEQQIGALENAALRLRALELEGGGIVPVEQIQKLVPKGAIIPDIDVSGAQQGVLDDLYAQFSGLAKEGRLREALEVSLEEVTKGVQFRWKPGVDKEFIEGLQRAISQSPERIEAPVDVDAALRKPSAAQTGAGLDPQFVEELARPFKGGLSESTDDFSLDRAKLDSAKGLFDALAESIEVARVPAGQFIEDLEALGQAADVNLRRINLPEVTGEKLSDFYVEESRRIKEATRDASLSIGEFAQARGSQTATETVVDRPDVLRGIEARRAALLDERRAYEDVIQARLTDKDPTSRISTSEAASLRQERDGLLAAKLAALEFAEGQRVLGVESEQLARSSSILGKEIDNLGISAGRETAESFAKMREQIELTRQAEEKRIVARENEGAPVGETDTARKQADEERDAALAGIALRESLAAVADETRALEAEQGFLGKSSALLGDRLTLLAARGLGETAEAFELMREQAALAREEAERGIQAREIQPGADLPSLARDRTFADDAQAAALAIIDQREAMAILADESRRGQVQQQLFGQASGILSEQLGILGDRARGDTAQAFAIMRRQIELARAAAEIEIVSQERDGRPSDEIQKARELADAQRDVALESLRTREALSDQRREFGELGQAASSFSGAAVDALFGIKTPADAARQAILEIGRAFIQPRIEAGFLGLFGEKGRDVAGQRGLGDLVERPPLELPDLPDPALTPRIAPDVALPDVGAELATKEPGLELGAVASAAAGGIEQLGVAAQLAATRLEGVQAAGPLATQGALGEALPEADAVVDQAADGGLTAGLAGQEASAGLAAAAGAGEIAAAGLGGAGEAATLAAVGLGKTDFAALALAGGLNSALQAALQFAAGAGGASAGSLVGGATALAGGAGAPAGAAPIVPRALGGGFLGITQMVRHLALGGAASGSAIASPQGGVVQALGSGGLPSVPDLSGRVIGKATYALIGEGSDREGVFPLDPRGGVRARGPRGESLTLPLSRDSEGKLGVTIDQQAAAKVAASREFALGGAFSAHVHADVRPFYLGGILGGGDDRERFAPAAAVSGGDSGVRQSGASVRVDGRQSRTVNFYSTVNVQGGSAPVVAGMRYSVRQGEQNIRSMLRQFAR